METRTTRRPSVATRPEAGLATIVGVVLAAAAPASCAWAGEPDAAAPRVLTLPEALRTARERQPQLAQARAGTAIARARADEARAGLLPQASASLGYQRTTANTIARPGVVSTGAMSWNTANNFSAALTVNQLIWDFDQTIGRWKASQSLARSQLDNELTVAAQVALLVRTAYFNARAGKALVAVARDTLANLQRHLEQSQGFVEAGTHPEIDLAQARTNLANGRALLVSAENAHLTSLAQLNQAMGVVGPTDFEVADDDASDAVEGEETTLEPLVEEAIKARPEMTALQLQLQAQRQTVGAVKGAYWPTFSGSLGSTVGGTALDGLGWNVEVGLSMNWNFFQGLLTYSQVHEAEAAADQLAAQLEVQRQQVRFDVEQARLSVRAAKASLEAQHDAVVNSREQLRLAEGRYQSGVGNSVELSDAQVAFTSSQAQAIQADDQLHVARAQLLHALGRP